jgi:EAL and modified HD-GYP domain-containing signal transduction protein
MYSYVARQPILDQDGILKAYELLFRDGKSSAFPDIDPDEATSNILTNSHLTLGISKVTGSLPAFINFHEDALLKHFPSFLNPADVVIEILEDVPASTALLKTCKSLKAKGFKLALDDFEVDAKWNRFLPYIDIIKMDILTISIPEIDAFIKEINQPHITYLAEKVETVEQFEALKKVGCTLFQGYFFAKPELLKQRRISTSKHSVLELLSHSSKKDFDFDEMSEIFEHDPGLTYKLLRFINSPIYGRSQEITSLKHALVYIGDTELKKFIALLALSDLCQNKPTEIMRMSLARAKFCEQVSNQKQHNENPPKAFLTGILSLIDGILDQDLITVMDILPIHSEIKKALTNGNNYLSGYLALSVHIERGEWTKGK